MSSVDDLRTTIRNWGNWFATQHNTSCKWTDLYAENPDMKQYQDMRLNVTVGPAILNLTPTSEIPSATFEDERNNNTDTEITSTFSFNEETTSTFSWSLTESVDVGVRAGITAPSPAGFITGEVSVNLSLSSTQQQEDQTTRYWSREEQVPVPPRSLIKAKMVIMQAQYDMEFTSDVTLTGYVAVWLKDKRDVYNPTGNNFLWLWFIPVGTVFSAQPVPGFTVVSNSEVRFQAKGRFKGVQGYKCVIDFQQYGAGLGDQSEEKILVKSWQQLVDGYEVQPASTF
jgi:hypothetical protein